MSYTPRGAYCKECNKLFVKKHAKTVRCPECQKAYNKKRQREIYKARAGKREQKQKETGCTRKKSCRYGGKLSGMPCCDYLLITGRKRPCPAKGCTEYRRKAKGSGSNETD